MGNFFTIEMASDASSLLISGSAGKTSMPSPIRIESKNPVILKTQGQQDKKYKAPLFIRNTGKQLIITCRLPLEEYIAGVIKGEMPSGRGEALLAQAVVARSYALKNQGKHKEEGYDFCDCTHCQVYKEAVSPGSPYYSAAYATKGLVLKYNGIPVEGLFHSTCGGRTSNPEDVYGAKEAGIRGIKDIDGRDGKILCTRSPHFHWQFIINGEKLKKILQGEPEFNSLDKIENIKVESKDAAGRVLTLAIIEKERTLRVSGYDFWQIMGSRAGWGKFKSALFTVKKSGDEYIFTGRGLGHGLGLCQWGAMRMAEKGCSFKEIIKHYFPDTEIRTIDH